MAKRTKKNAELENLEKILLETQDTNSQRYRFLRNAGANITESINMIKRLIRECKKSK
jgi:hypothetical protein